MPKKLIRWTAAVLVLVPAAIYKSCLAAESASTMVTYERLVKADQEPGNWLTYSGAYNGQRFSPLAEINRGNVHQLRLEWVFPFDTSEPVETTPLVVDNVMYFTRPPNDVVALDLRTFRTLWEFNWPLPDNLEYLCCGKINRGLAMLDDTLYLGTLDAHLVAIDAKTGKNKWVVQVADNSIGYHISAAPLAVKDMIITGTVISQYYFGRQIRGAIPEARGRIDAYDASTGALRWRFYTIPGPGEPGNETWAGDSWKVGRSSSWMTGSYDPELNLVYWGIGNPAPGFQGYKREGDNLYANSVVALNADTGRLKWHFQFTPHDEHDWDAAHIFVLADMKFSGRLRKLLLNANRNAFFYVLDRQTGEFLLARPYAKQTWAETIDANGRPILKPNIAPSKGGTVVSPSADGATNWWSSSFSPNTGLYYVKAHDGGEAFFSNFSGGMARKKEKVVSTVRALNPATGAIRWEFVVPGRKRSTAGILTTAGEILFTGGSLATGDFWALDSVTGKKLWQGQVRGWIHAAPITYKSGGKQFVTIASSKGVFTFAIAPENYRSDDVTSSAGDPRLGAGDPRLGHEKAIKCSRCHGFDGLGKLPIYPHLAGQSAVYLAKQLRDFRDGRRENSVMSPIAKNLSDPDIDDLAEYFSRIEIEVKAPVGTGPVRAGEVLDVTDSWLRVGDGNDAFLVYSSDNQKKIRIVIQRAVTDPWDVQLNLKAFLVQSESRYAVQFRARADSSRTINVGFSLAHKPWTSLGLYRKVQVTSKWENFSLEFVATADEDQGRIHFDAGDSEVSFEVSDVVLHSLPQK